MNNLVLIFISHNQLVATPAHTATRPALPGLSPHIVSWLDPSPPGLQQRSRLSLCPLPLRDTAKSWRVTAPFIVLVALLSRPFSVPSTLRFVSSLYPTPFQFPSYAQLRGDDITLRTLSPVHLVSFCTGGLFQVYVHVRVFTSAFVLGFLVCFCLISASPDWSWSILQATKPLTLHSVQQSIFRVPYVHLNSPFVSNWTFFCYFGQFLFQTRLKSQPLTKTKQRHVPNSDAIITETTSI